jgi:hypothetical protein
MKNHINIVCILLIILFYKIFGFDGFIFGLLFSAYWIWSMKFFVEDYFPLLSRVAIKIHQIHEIAPLPEEVYDIFISYNDFIKNQKMLFFHMYASFIIMPRLIINYFILKRIDKVL